MRKRYYRKPAGYRAAERAKAIADKKWGDPLDRIENTRAQTLAGLMAKARLAHDDEQPTQSPVKDLRALAEAVQS